MINKIRWRQMIGGLSTFLKASTDRVTGRQIALGASDVVATVVEQSGSDS